MSEQNADPAAVLAAFSDQLANAVEGAGRSVVRVDARGRQPASGIVWGADGLILTADHVVEREEDIAVGLPDGRSVGAKIVGRDPGTDIALLRAEAGNLDVVEQGPPPRVGHVALVVARPGEGLATSIGVVSALTGPVRTWRGGRLQGLIRTDAVLYPGFSGGPLVDASGQITGMATSHFGQGAGFAVPLETIGRVTGSLLSHGRVRRGFLGVSSQPVAIPERLRTAAGVQQETGLLVVGVESGGPGERGGLLIGDVLIALNGQPTRHTEDLRGLLGQESVGQATPVRVIRGGQITELTVTVGERT
jgi:S1-C subfamily serine protease